MAPSEAAESSGGGGGGPGRWRPDTPPTTAPWLPAAAARPRHAARPPPAGTEAPNTTPGPPPAPPRTPLPLWPPPPPATRIPATSAVPSAAREEHKEKSGVKGRLKLQPEPGRLLPLPMRPPTPLPGPPCEVSQWAPPATALRAAEEGREPALGTALVGRDEPSK